MMNAVKQMSGRLSCRREEGCHEDVINAALLMRRRLSCRCKENFQADERVVEGKGCTATKIPFLGIARPQPQFPHS